MQPGMPELAAEPIGFKWYVQSGQLKFVVHTDLGPSEACWRFFNWAERMEMLPCLGPHFICSQRGYGPGDVAWFINTREYLAKQGISPTLLDEMEQ